MKALALKGAEIDTVGFDVSSLDDRCRFSCAGLVYIRSIRLEPARSAGIGALLLLTALCTSSVAAQPDRAAADDRRAAPVEPIEEVTVIGQRSLGELRLEVQAAREQVYELFSFLNGNEEFDIHCRDEPRTGTRIPQRVCRPRFANAATEEAVQAYLMFVRWGGWGDGQSLARAVMSEVPGKERQLAAEVQRLTRENREFRQAIAEYQAAERRYEHARSAEGPVIQTSVSVIDTVPAPASSARAAQSAAITAPSPVDLAAPSARSSGRGAARDGWVKLRYSVRADGRTADVRAVDAMPPELDPLGTVSAAEAWTFEPAKAEGVPIDWHNNLAVVAFSGGESVGWTEFAEAFEEVAELIASGRYRDAKSRNEHMLREHAVTLEEIGLAQMQLAAIEHVLGDSHAALAAIRRATERGITQLAEDELSLALEHRFALELELGRAADALQTYERRIALGRLRSRDPLARQGAVLRQALSSPEATLAVQGRIGPSGEWEYALTWGTFAVVDVDGRIEDLESECHRNRVAMPFEADKEMTIPAAWGVCVLTIRGRPGTTFILYEFRLSD